MADPFQFQREALIGGSPLGAVAPALLFGGVDDDAWHWLNLEGAGRCPFLARYLPSLPPEAEQSRVNARTGRESLELGFRIYSLFKQLYAEERAALSQDQRVLDFGCGWGRVIRFFLKDVAPEKLVGIDIDEQAISACRETNRWCQFHVSSVLPPSNFEDESFDLVYAYSVFSHLSEEAHLGWLAEFERILEPGGVLLLTTLGRSFIERSSRWTDEEGVGSISAWQRRAAGAFPDSQAGLDAYDRGEYCYGPIDRERNPHFGFTCIPEQYVLQRWSRHFDIRRWLPSPDPRLQTMIVCRKAKS
jgi:SAM-dependent methyltransferase